MPIYNFFIKLNCEEGGSKVEFVDVRLTNMYYWHVHYFRYIVHTTKKMEFAGKMISLVVLLIVPFVVLGNLYHYFSVVIVDSKSCVYLFGLEQRYLNDCAQTLCTWHSTEFSRAFLSFNVACFTFCFNLHYILMRILDIVLISSYEISCLVYILSRVDS